ncbi:hypothetical protein K438DRAFT_1967204 [Mycena galopus ATCC 62051]|nr:hypothetical protein K438DRAFT_1967204 [Mycena galopus ATCC 62051]
MSRAPLPYAHEWRAPPPAATASKITGLTAPPSSMHAAARTGSHLRPRIPVRCITRHVPARAPPAARTPPLTLAPTPLQPLFGLRPPALSSVGHDAQRLAENYSSFLRRRLATYPEASRRKERHGSTHARTRLNLNPGLAFFGCRVVYAQVRQRWAREGRREEGNNGDALPHLAVFSARVTRVVFLAVVPICDSSIATNATLCMTITHTHPRGHSFLRVVSPSAPPVLSAAHKPRAAPIRVRTTASRPHPPAWHQSPSPSHLRLPSSVCRVSSRLSRLSSHSFSFSGSAPRPQTPASFSLFPPPDAPAAQEREEYGEYARTHRHCINHSSPSSSWLVALTRAAGRMPHQA